MSQICKVILCFISGTSILATLGSRGRYQCHCSGGCNGNIEDYDCRGSCEKGFYGRYCQKENVALNKSTNQSPMCEHPWGGAAYLAVDGNTTTRFGEDNEPHPCTCAMGNLTTYWSVDLGQKYALHDMMVYQRNENRTHHRLRGMYITVDNRECWRWTGRRDPPTQFNVTCNQTGREVTFKVNRTEYISLCEVIIFVCTDFWYGADCDKTCNCRDQTEVCDKRTGKCTDCPDGWTGDDCNDCSDGYWGTSCRMCGHCETGDTCDKTTGHCSQCEIAWMLPSCTVCNDGYWGTSCKRCGHCETGDICDKTTGHCTQCEIGWELPRCTEYSSTKGRGDCSNTLYVTVVGVLSVLLVLVSAAFIWSIRRQNGTAGSGFLNITRAGQQENSQKEEDKGGSVNMEREVQTNEYETPLNVSEVAQNIYEKVS